MAGIPKTMRAAAIDRFGGPEELTIHTLPVPEIGTRELLVAVHTAGVGSWDADIRAGWWPEGRPKFPLVLGTDGSGLVAKVGSQVRGFEPDDEVYAYSFANPKGGFYAEYVAVAAANVGHKPSRLKLEEAGAIGTTGLTALQGVELLGIRKRDPYVVFGASGGVGTLAVQFAKWKGARILAVAAGKDGVRLVNDLAKLDVAIDGKRDDVAEEVEKFAPDGLAGVIAFAGGEALDACVDRVRPGGRVVYPNGVEPAPKRRRGIEVDSYDAEASPEQFKRLNDAIEDCRLKVAISASFPLKDAAKAHERMAAGHVIGKIVLDVR
ncbi:MAG: NADP-dependent oxidoreductase [Deltaproteobacteria bacterium]|nr:MAG: NADP-dependent oxidoreductase [Deltaproteobacteria bacterium]